jgi:hypothetical protein
MPTPRETQILRQAADMIQNSSESQLELIIGTPRLDVRIRRLAAAELASRQTVSEEEIAAEMAAMEAEG